MARRSSARSRSSRSSRSSGADRSAGGGRSARSGGRGGAPRARSDGRVDAPCPQCGTVYRVAQDALDQKLECQECHRVFFPKTTAGHRAKAQDNTKVYMGFAAAFVFIVLIFMVTSMSSGTPPAQPAPPVEAPSAYTLGTHPRTKQAVNWAQAIHTDNHLVIETHSDLRKMAEFLGIESSSFPDVLAAIKQKKEAMYLRDLECTSGRLLDETMMDSPTGKVVVDLLPERDSKDYQYDRAEIELSFHVENSQVKIESWRVVRQIRRLTPDPYAKKTFVPNKDIERAKMVEITDSGGTRKVMESEPGPVPHWEGADAVLRKKVDEIIAGVLRSADNDGPPIARFTLQIQTLEERKAAVPRALNAMYELYGDTLGNNMRLSQLNQALVTWTGMAVNYQVKDSGNPERDKKERESCVRQWFGFWWRYSSGDLSDFLDLRDNLEEPLPGEEKKETKK